MTDMTQPVPAEVEEVPISMQMMETAAMVHLAAAVVAADGETAVAAGSVEAVALGSGMVAPSVVTRVTLEQAEAARWAELSSMTPEQSWFRTAPSTTTPSPAAWPTVPIVIRLPTTAATLAAQSSRATAL
jgi:hypothetical protein